MSKTLESILERHAEYLDRVANEMQFPDSENVDDIKQAILQWVADEVVQNEIRDETWPVFRQLEILKQHGWKGGEG